MSCNGKSLPANDCPSRGYQHKSSPCNFWYNSRCSSSQRKHCSAKTAYPTRPPFPHSIPRWYCINTVPDQTSRQDHMMAGNQAIFTDRDPAMTARPQTTLAARPNESPSRSPFQGYLFHAPMTPAKPNSAMRGGGSARCTYISPPPPLTSLLSHPQAADTSTPNRREHVPALRRVLGLLRTLVLPQTGRRAARPRRTARPDAGAAGPHAARVRRGRASKFFPRLMWRRSRSPTSLGYRSAKLPE